MKKKRNKSLKPYNTNGIKAGNFLTNISYNGLMEEDFYNRNFVFGIYVLLAKTLYSFSVEHKIQDSMNQEMLHMLWSEFIPEAFFKHICKNENIFI